MYPQNKNILKENPLCRGNLGLGHRY